MYRLSITHFCICIASPQNFCYENPCRPSEEASLFEFSTAIPSMEQTSTSPCAITMSPVHTELHPPFPVRSLSILPLIQLIALLPYLRRAKALIILTPADSWVNSRIHAGLSLMNVTRSHQHGIWKSVPVLSASSSGLLPKRGSYDVHLSFSLPDFRIRSLVLAV